MFFLDFDFNMWIKVLEKFKVCFGLCDLLVELSEGVLGRNFNLLSFFLIFRFV